MNIRTLITTVAILAVGSAFAQAPAPKDPAATPRIDQRQAEQQKRIDQGVASGQLTPKEAARMQKRQDKIAAQETAAKADGKVTKGERRKIKANQDNASRAIVKEKHDKQHTAPAAAK